MKEETLTENYTDKHYRRLLKIIFEQQQYLKNTDWIFAAAETSQ